MWCIDERSKDGRWAFIRTWKKCKCPNISKKNAKNNEDKMKEDLRKLHAQRLFWKPNNRNALCWAFDYVNDNKKVDLITFQIMHCIFWYNSRILNLNSKTQGKRGLIIYNTTNGIIALRKHVNVDHSILFNFFEE